MDFTVFSGFAFHMVLNWFLIYSIKAPNISGKPNAKYITAKSGFLRKILIRQKGLNGKYDDENCRNKLYYSCLFWYIALAVIAIIAVVFYFIPEIPCDEVTLPLFKRRSVVLDTLNVKIPYTLAFLMSFLQLDFMLVPAIIKTIGSKNQNVEKSAKVITVIATVAFLAFTVYLMYVLIK